ncbi:ComEA family DNA-binding protein [Salinicola endophyticus]|uniref:ComEA family DNA-binding protein n=1 Tax=Salinicola endophyticus TaxID=1949083 RepID=A0ABY8FML8_9GAMM|nr:MULTISPECIES: ComEA family DNA-binding protein [Salinicola]WFF43290.1 ComEA family DNA-binding protein [Salinicola endophyticus]
MKKLFGIALLSLFMATSLPALAEPVDLNQADAETLATLPGIGKVRAQAIVEDRKANGPYQSLDELTRVDGIGATTVAKLKDEATL